MAKKKGKPRRQSGDRILKQQCWRKRSSKTVPFTYALALWYSELDALREERAPSQAWVAKLVKEMDGHYLADKAQLSTAYCTWDKQWRKVDGQHLALARMKYGTERLIDANTNAEIMATVTRYEVDSYECLRALYIHIQNERIRSEPHKRKVVGMGVAEWEGHTATNRDRVMSGMQYWIHPEVDTLKKRAVLLESDDLIEMIRADDNLTVAAQHALDLIAATAKSTTKRSLGRKAVVAAMLECITSAYEAKAIEFFTALSDLTTVGTRGMATRTLYDWIIRWEKKDNDRERRDNVDWFNAVVQAFTYYRLGKSLHRISRPKKTGRLRISKYDWRTQSAEPEDVE